MHTEPDESRYPPISDPVWAEWSAPVLVFLDGGPRTWPDIHAWRKRVRFSDGLLRHCVAWLEDRRLVRGFQREGDVRWVSVDWLRRAGLAMRDPEEVAVLDSAESIGSGEVDQEGDPDVEGA